MQATFKIWETNRKLHLEFLEKYTLEQLNKIPEGFKNNLKGATKSNVYGKTEGVIRYKKLGKYIDIASDGRIISFGMQ